MRKKWEKKAKKNKRRKRTNDINENPHMQDKWYEYPQLKMAFFLFSFSFIAHSGELVREKKTVLTTYEGNNA
jgi:hypothetical protein